MEIFLIATNSVLIMFLWFAVIELYKKIDKDSKNDDTKF